jgi:hypothetical protein
MERWGLPEMSGAANPFWVIVCDENGLCASKWSRHCAQDPGTARDRNRAQDSYRSDSKARQFEDDTCPASGLRLAGMPHLRNGGAPNAWARL